MSNARKIVIVNTAAMLHNALYASGVAVEPSKLSAMKGSIRKVVNERVAYEATQSRKLGDGSVIVGQSADIRHVEALAESEDYARFCLALGINPRVHIYPQSTKSGKTGSDTSNLKSYKKAREIAECVFSSVPTSLENVAKVFAVCAYKACETSTISDNVIPRNYAECFLNSPEFRSIRTGAQELFDAVDDIRARQMTGGGAKTQASQMIRTLVAFGAAEDVRNGRAKDVRINPQHPLMQALMTRFGVVTAPDAEVVEQVAA